MELSALSENIVPVPFKRGSETIELQVNIDAFTPEFFRAQKERANAKLKELKKEIARLKHEESQKKADKPKRLSKAKKAELAFEQEAEQSLVRLENIAQEVEAERQSYAELLSSNVLKGWDVTENGIPIEPTMELLMRLPPRGLKEMWLACIDAAKTVKKKADDQTEETLGSTPSGSRELRVVGQTL